MRQPAIFAAVLLLATPAIAANDLAASPDQVCQAAGRSGPALAQCRTAEARASSEVAAWLKRHALLDAAGRPDSAKINASGDANSPGGVARSCMTLGLYSEMADCIDESYGLDG